MLELQADDTAAAGQDVLTELSFHIPPANQDFPPSNGEESASKAFLDQVGTGCERMGEKGRKEKEEA